jgi:hypothetical protein
MMDDLLHEMIDPAPVPHDRPRRLRMWTTIVIIGLAAVGATTLTTSAIFTDNDSASADIKTGSVDLVVGSTTFASSVALLAPGDSTFLPLTVSNKGSLELRYAISYRAEQLAITPSYPDAPAGNGDLRQMLELRTYAVDATLCNAEGVASIATINRGGVAATTWPTDPLELVKLVGDTTSGLDAGDRTLPGASAAASLCARVDFKLGADNSYQNTGAKLTLVFDAEQTLNN